MIQLSIVRNIGVAIRSGRGYESRASGLVTSSTTTVIFRLMLSRYPTSTSLFCLVLAGMFLVSLEQSFATEFYVSVDGSAQADGSLANPYGSIPDAVKAVRALRQAGNTEPITINLRSGRHQLNETLVLGLADGDPAAADVQLEQYGAGNVVEPAFLTFAAYPGEQAVVSGGIPITGWKRFKSAPTALPAEGVDKVWVADMPASMDRFYTLYDSRGRLKRTGMPALLTQSRAMHERYTFPQEL